MMQSQIFVIIFVAIVGLSGAKASSCRGEVKRFMTPQWVSPGVKAKVPDVLRDPFVIEALTREDFRLFLLDSVSREGAKAPIQDFKQIADALPRRRLDQAVAEVGREAQTLSNQELVDYILKNYRLADAGVLARADINQIEPVPQSPLLNYRLGNWVAKAVVEIHRLWGELLFKSDRDDGSTLLKVPKPYVVAGGRFREFYYWDSFWIMKGLLLSGYSKIAVGMLENFVYLYERYRIIPNGNRFYYLSRTQVPLFIEMVTLLKDAGVLDFSRAIRGSRVSNSLEARIIKVADSYFETVWLGTPRYKAEQGLFGFFDNARGGETDPNVIVVRPEAHIRESRLEETLDKRIMAESGLDFSYTRYGTQPGNWLPVELNFILYDYCGQLAGLLREVGQTTRAQVYSERQAQLKISIQKQLFDPQTGFYLDRNFVTGELSGVVSAASLFPFYYRFYDQSLGRKKLLELLAILKPQGHKGIHTTNKEGPGQWDGEWSWAPFNEIAFQSLVRYGLHKEAGDLALDYLEMTLRNFQKTGNFYEKQRASDGGLQVPRNSEIYGNETGFGWTNGSSLIFIEYLAKAGRLKELEQRLDHFRGY
ncbi:MAG: hypothetical protein IT288_13100 [Bdellovibrionales bacterium]|nr:hypothetical protein [Bdellovibrionales bacterium]